MEFRNKYAKHVGYLAIDLYLHLRKLLNAKKPIGAISKQTVYKAVVEEIQMTVI